ncbi:IME4 Transcriptional activator, adenine-specific DNA methyltransferase [uncultured Caudovirales phage]|uniref:IME4 Transcriptional activator, adenine-specific DNA methyltransferase n=1 Tax=uncultured Caudovirales phage TaxID=2100421 RepID=A0A6J5KZ98_9CAUD|nr:IME4 Transcriptional activator, adenine-specific DNA methyltransferase [uncultured Caudovirales phage]
MKLDTLEEGFGKFDVVLSDPPWPYFGDPNKMGAAGKHYDLMDEEDIFNLPVKKLFRDPKHAAVFVWATCPKLDLAVEAIRRWGFHFRGVPFIWVKTRKDGAIKGAQGVAPTAVKPITEMILLGTGTAKGRPFPLLNFKARQVILAPVGEHSAKPAIFHQEITSLYGPRPSLEMFSRRSVDGWDRWGNEAPKEQG